MNLKSMLTVMALLALSGQPKVYANEVPVIAAASDLSYALGKVAYRFTRDTGQKIRISYGSSGNLVRLIEQGAPFEMFMSADENYVFKLAEQGQTIDRGRIYALGRLVLFAVQDSALQHSLDLTTIPDLLASGSLSKFAIANPLHAPYGKAAREVLLSTNLWQSIETALVFGESASQATLFAISGSTQGAIIPHSLVLNPEISSKGSFRLIDTKLHSPLRQRMVLLSSASDTTHQFYRYMQTPAVREILKQYGFTTSHES